MKLVNIKVRKEDVTLSHEDLVSLMADSMYGSSWLGGSMNASDSTRVFLKNKYGECCEDTWAGMLLEGGSIILLDYYEEDDNGDAKEYEVTLNNFKDAVILAYTKEENAWIRKGLEDENEYDSITADAFMQLVMFGEVVYG